MGWSIDKSEYIRLVNPVHRREIVASLQENYKQATLLLLDNFHQILVLSVMLSLQCIV